jgi:hypothetical protein
MSNTSRSGPEIRMTCKPAAAATNVLAGYS